MTLFGQASLTARRLVEAGGRFVTVFWDEFGLAGTGWDTHWDHFPRMKDELLPGPRRDSFGAADRSRSPRAARRNAGRSLERARPDPQAGVGAGGRPRPLVALLLGRDGRRRRETRLRAGQVRQDRQRPARAQGVAQGYPRDHLSLARHRPGHDPHRSAGAADGTGTERGPKVNRRRFLGFEMEPFIDAHSHIWTPDVAHYPLAAGFKVADMQPRSFTAEELLALCRPAGVGRVNLIQMSYYEFDNRYMLDMIKLYPDRFVGTAIVDPLGRRPGTIDARRSARAACMPSAFSPTTASSRQPAGSSRRVTRRCSPRPHRPARRSRA